MPKLLVVIARLNVGGTAQYVGALTKSMQDHGYEVAIATGFTQGSEVEDPMVRDLPIIRIKSLGRKVSLGKDIKARSELKGVVKSFEPDIIYSHTFKAGALVRSLKLKQPVVHAFHGHLIDEPELAGFKVRVVMVIERLLAKRARFLVTVGKNVSRELVDAGVGLRGQYLSIAPGVSALELIDEKLAREKLGLVEETRPIVAWLARVVAVKAPHRVIEIARKIPEARFILAGGGNLLEEIRSEAPQNLSILGWQDARVIWSVADLAISTSENEGMPVALIEAQLAGVPVVALDVGSVAEVVEDGRTGFVHSEFDDEFITSIRRLLEDRSLLETLGHQARVRAQEKFSPDRFTQDHLRLFDSVRNPSK